MPMEPWLSSELLPWLVFGMNSQLLSLTLKSHPNLCLASSHHHPCSPTPRTSISATGNHNILCCLCYLFSVEPLFLLSAERPLLQFFKAQLKHHFLRELFPDSLVQFFLPVYFQHIPQWYFYRSICDTVP